MNKTKNQPPFTKQRPIVEKRANQHPTSSSRLSPAQDLVTEEQGGLALKKVSWESNLSA